MMPTMKVPTFDESDAPVAPGAVSSFELLRYHAGELSAERRAAIDALLSTDAALSARLSALRADAAADDAAVRVAVPLPAFLAEQAQRAGSNRRMFGLFPMPRTLFGQMLVGGPALAAAAVCVMMLRPAADVAYDGTKGGGELAFFVAEDSAAGAGATPGRDGQKLRPGTRIQFAVKDDDSLPAMVLVGVDARHQVTVYAAEVASGDREKGAGAPRPLQSSVILDDSIGPERFFLIRGDAPLVEVREVAEDAANAIALGGGSLLTDTELLLPSGFRQSSVHIVKTAN